MLTILLRYIKHLYFKIHVCVHVHIYTSIITVNIYLFCMFKMERVLSLVVTIQCSFVLSCTGRILIRTYILYVYVTTTQTNRNQIYFGCDKHSTMIFQFYRGGLCTVKQYLYPQMNMFPVGFNHGTTRCNKTVFQLFHYAVTGWRLWKYSDY